MKEIRYDGDLYGNICEDRQKDYGYFVSILILGIIGTIASYFWIPNFIIMLGIILGGSLGRYSIFKMQMRQKVEKAIYKMKKDADIDVSCDELQKSILIQNKKISRLKCGKNMSREEKIIKYFQFLDREDQIQILKQVQTVIGKEKIDNELYLLEDEDLEKEGLQFVKK